MARSKPFMRAGSPVVEEPSEDDDQVDNLFLAWLSQWALPDEAMRLPEDDGV